jgi:CRISPR-associated protein Cmr5
MTLEQQRAALAFQHVQTVGTDHQDTYGSRTQKLPALIRSAGLCQALHFVKSRGKTKPSLITLLAHLAEQLKRTDPGITNVDSLCETVRTAKLSQYLWLTREALATVTWYSRLSRAEWGILTTTDDKD